MDFSAIASHSPSRWALPITVFGFVFCLFEGIERISSSEIRQRLTAFLSTGKYESYLGVLPHIVQSTFNRAFGERHVSRKCLGMSCLLSVLSICLTFVVSYLYNPSGFMLAFSAWDKGIAVAAEKVNNPVAKQFIRYLFDVAHGHLPFAFLAIWLLWCLIPDYLALLKTRIVIVVVANTKPGAWSLVSTILVDFVVGSWAFLTSFIVPQSILLVSYLGTHSVIKVDSLDAIMIALIVISGLLFALEATVVAATGMLYTSVPIGNIFWASMVPSMWLWVYVLSAVVTRGLMTSKPALRRLLYFLDVQQHPIRSLGVVAGAVMAAGEFVILVVLSFA